MVKHSNFPSDQRIYSTDVLEYPGLWPAFRPIHKLQLKAPLSAKSVLLWLVSPITGGSDFPGSVSAGLLG